MQLFETRRATRHRKRWKKYAIIGALVVLAVVGWQAWEKGQPRYLKWKQVRALEQAKEFIKENDAPNAQLALEVALKTIPGNPETLRVAAELLESVGSADAMRLRRAVVQAHPDSAEDAARLVLCCLRFRDFNAAKDALSRIPPAVASQPAALQAALAFALTTNNSPVADYIFDQLKRASPDDKNLLHAHALLLLKHPQDDVRQKAEADLNAIAQNDPTLALQVNRELASAALLRRDYPTAQLRMKAILADPKASFSDRLRKANVDLVIDHQPFDPIFAELAPLATAHEADAVEFAQWLLIQERAADVDRWIAALPEDKRQLPSIKGVHADAIAQLKEWDRLNTAIADGAWGPIPADVLKLAMAAKTVDNPAKPSLRRETWEMTLAAAGGKLSSLRVLQRLASVWQWSEESELTLWTIARTYPAQTWSHQALFNFYRQKKDTANMRDVMALLRSSDGSVVRYQHDWALLALLLEPTANWNPAKDTMQKLHDAEPTNATYSTGYAFALAQAGKAAEAMAVVEKIAPAERDYPPRQPYLAFVYGVARKSDELERARKLVEGLPLLPEETYLFTRAHEELTRKPEKPKTPKPATPEAIPSVTTS